MKRIVYIILFLVAVSLGCFAQQRTATLSHNGKLTVFNSERCLPEAYDAAVDGDTIYLSSGDWYGAAFQTNGNFTITKKISFIGNGRSTLLDGFVWLDFKDRDDKRLKATLFDGVSIGTLDIHNGGSNIEIKNCRIYGLSIRPQYSTDSIDFKIRSCETKVSLDNTKGRDLLKGVFENSKVKVDFFDVEGWDFNDGQNISFFNCNINISGASTFSGYASSSIVFGKSYEMRPKKLENCLYQWTEVVHDAEWEEREKSEYINCYELTYTSETDMILDENLDYVGPDLVDSGYVGTDGTQVGIYGGEHAPYTEYPSMRCVDSENSVMTYDGYRNITLDLKFFEKESDRIVGFRSLHNSAELGYVPMDYAEGGRLKATVSIPDSLIPSIAGKTINLDRDNNEVWVDAISDDSFGIQPMTESGWGVFTANVSPLVDRYSTKLVEIEKDSPGIEFEKYRGSNFHAVSFKVGAAGIYVNASQQGCFDVYNTSISYGPMTLVASVSSEELKSGHFLDLPAGTYCGVLYDMPIDEDNPDAYITLKMGESRPESPSITYNGRFLTINTSEDNCVIKYSFDPNDTEGIYYGSSYYGTPVDLDGKLGVVRAWCHRLDDGVDSNPTEFNILGYGGNSRAITSKPGVLGSCYEWNEGRIPDARFSVEGSLDASDYEWINTQRKLLHLDLTDVTSDSIPAGAFHSTLRSLVLPSGIKNISGNIFRRKQSNLCALKWTSTNPIPAGMLDSLINRNLLLYVDDASLTTNVYPRNLYPIHLVASGVSIGIDFNVQDWFYCPEEFIAKQVVLDRYFYKETGINGECAGWETILIPFDVQNVVDNRYDDELFLDMIPFGVNPEEERLRYWLYAPTISGWERATAIKANEPYLIAMPKNELYYGPFNVGGFVSFSASNAVVHATPDEIIRDFTGGRKLVGNYDGFDMSPEEYEKVLGINPDTVEIDGKSYRPGSVFVPCHNYYGYHIVVHPFEAYMLAEGEQALRKMEIFTSSEVEDVLADMEMKVWTENGGIRIKAGFTARVDVFDMTGRCVAVADVKAGEVCRVDGLAPGIYIAANRKVLLK